MNCIVTAGPAYEPLDDVRQLTNFSTRWQGDGNGGGKRRGGFDFNLNPRERGIENYGMD